MLVSEKIAPPARVEAMDNLTFRKALEIGFCQCLAIIPGVSRSGASIVGARFLGVERKAATEFSFFLAIPTLFGAAALDLLKNIHNLSGHDLPIFTAGTVMAFISAFFIVNRLIDFVGKHGFAPFGWYRIAVGFAVIALLFMHVLQ
jgi:undecaprenyl-diphosphatase